jgi:hypothetical protein
MAGGKGVRGEHRLLSRELGARVRSYKSSYGQNDASIKEWSFTHIEFSIRERFGDGIRLKRRYTVSSTEENPGIWNGINSEVRRSSEKHSG